MSNPTTPFGWQMPENTDLVTDLPADFEVFGQAVATSMADLLGGTTGQILAKTSATDMDFTWTTPNPGDITGVTAGVGISGGGTSGDVTVTNSMATAFTTSGDLIQATGSGTFARLGTGTSGQYLTTNGTTNSWAAVAGGSFTQLATGSFSGASTTISGIDQTYQDLLVVIKDISNTVGYGVGVRLNNNTTGSVGYSYLSSQSSTDVTSGTTSSSFMNGADTTTSGLYGQLLISNYTATGTKSIQWNCARSSTVYTVGGATSAVTAAVTSLVFLRENGSATFSFNGGTYIVYGVK